MKNLTITISGPAGSGKTLFAALLKDFLVSHRFKHFSVNDIDLNTGNVSMSRIFQAVTAFSQCDDINVELTTIQTRENRDEQTSQAVTSTKTTTPVQVCPDCGGTGKEYVGFNQRDYGRYCSTCQGTGKKT